jgi:hypothetical protein
MKHVDPANDAFRNYAPIDELRKQITLAHEQVQLTRGLIMESAIHIEDIRRLQTEARQLCRS